MCAAVTKKIISLCLVFLFLLSLFGCSEELNSDINNTSYDYDMETNSESHSAITETEQPTEEIDYSIPDEFVDYRKFIGQNISVLNVDTSDWDNSNDTHDLWNGSFYGHNGKVSVELGWDDETIIGFFLVMNDDFNINDDERRDLEEKVKSIFGNDVEETNISFTCSGLGDYEFEIYNPSPQECAFWVTWNMDIRYDYMLSKPTEPPTESVTKKETPKKEPSIGMTATEVRNSTWGNPSKINKTTTKYGVHEQWVYSSGRYIYFDDGIVTSIQEQTY